MATPSKISPIPLSPLPNVGSAKSSQMLRVQTAARTGDNSGTTARKQKAAGLSGNMKRQNFIYLFEIKFSPVNLKGTVPQNIVFKKSGHIGGIHL